jgi:hypothetical protein
MNKKDNEIVNYDDKIIEKNLFVSEKENKMKDNK